MTDERRQAHAYLDLLPEEKVSAIRTVLEAMVDPLSRTLANAPEEDADISAEEEQTVTQSREWLKHNRGIPLEEVIAEFGLTMAELESMDDPPSRVRDSRVPSWEDPPDGTGEGRRACHRSA